MNIRGQITLLLLFLSFWTLAQEYSFDVQHINIEDGMPDREVFSIVQDKEGFIWLSNQGAISRYDGYSFKTYRSQELNISEDLPTYLAVDDKNNIWYCEVNQRFAGVIDTKQDRIYSLEEYTDSVFSSRRIHTLIHDVLDKKKWYVITKEGFIYESGKFKSPINEQPINIETTTTCTSDSLGNYWITNNQKNASYLTKKQEWSTYSFPHRMAISRIIQVHPLVVETMAHEYKRSYLELKDKAFLPMRQRTDISTNIHCVVHSEQQQTTYFKNDTLFIKDHTGDIKLQYSKTESKDVDKTFRFITTFQDRQHTRWIGMTNGLLKVDPKQIPFTLYDKKNMVFGIYQEGDHLWIGGDRRNVKIDLSSGIATPFVAKSIDKGRKVSAFLKDQHGNLWIGVPQTLLQYPPKQEQPIPYTIKHGVSCLLDNESNNEIWIGSNYGMSIFNKINHNIRSVLLPPHDPSSVVIRHFHQNKNGIWVLTDKGIYLLNPSDASIIQQYDSTNGLPFNNYNHLYEDEEGIFWLASRGNGLIRWDWKQNTFKSFTQEEGLSNNTIYAVYEDDYERLWLPSNYGLMAFDKNTFDTKIYLPANGIAHEEFNTHAHFQATDGTLYFGGFNGITSFHPKDMQNENASVPLLLTKVKVLKKEQETFIDKTLEFRNAGKIILQPDDQILDLELSFLDYAKSSEHQFAYKIKGYQEQWIYTKENKISFINLPAGKYNLILKGRGESGSWSNQILDLPLEVETPFYKQWWFIFLMASLGIGLLVALVKWRINALEKDRQRLETEVQKRTQTIEEDKQIILTQAEELKQLDKAKTKFFSNITHEFRTPLTLIIGSTEQLLKETQPAQQQKQQRVLKNAQHLLGLINQLLDLSKLESGRMTMEYYRGNIVDYTSELVALLQPMAEQKNQQLIYTSEKEVWSIIFDKAKWDKIIYNLLSNAIKFTPAAGNILITLHQVHTDAGEEIQLEVADTGRGIAKEQLNQIFNRFYQVDGSFTREQEGTGIGLALVKELVELQKGSIEVKSEVGKGTSFFIQIPVIIPSSSIEEIPILENYQAAAIPIVEQDTTPTNISPTFPLVDQEFLQLLIVEDNEDMRSYIKECVSNGNYQIHEATNGEEGMQKANALVPDLIISDVMMPKMNGYDLTQAVRANLSTSHIPIVLLTAKASLESRLEGLQRGADAYLSKPFSVEELKIRIKKLIEIRQLLQLRYSSDIRSEESNYSYTQEDAFIEELKMFILTHLEDHLEKNTLSADNIGKHFKMSRMQLHRKLKALTNQTTSEFINAIRFEKAIALLQEERYNISEIAYKVGYSSPRYFSKIFKEKFGKSPSKF